MTTYPEVIVDKNGKATTVHKGRTVDTSVVVTRVAPKIKAKPENPNKMRSFDELDARRTEVERLIVDNGDTESLDVQFDILDAVAGFDSDDMMNEAGAIDYVYENYDSDHDYYDVANSTLAWIFNH